MQEHDQHYSNSLIAEQGSRAEVEVNQNAGRVAFYLGLRSIFKDYANNYADWQASKSFLTREEKQEARIKAQTALEDFYFAQNSSQSLQRLREQWGREGEVFEGLIQRALPQIQNVHEKTISQAEKFSERQRIMTALRSAFLITSMTEDQRRRLFMSAGYDRDETEHILKKIGIAAVLGTSLSTTSEWIAAATLGVGILNPVLQDITDPKTLALVILSYGTYAIGIGINAEQNVRLIRNEQTKTCTSFLSTSAFYLFNKLLPERKQDWMVRLGSVAFDILRQARTAPLLPTSFGPSVVVGANIAGTTKQAVQAVAIAVWLKTHHNRKP